MVKINMKLKVEQLAKIEEATIEVKNLTIFVGKNSTNKSYMAHTIYMVNKIISTRYNIADNIGALLFQDYHNTDMYAEHLELLQTIKERSLPNLHGDHSRTVILDFSSINISDIIKDIEDFLLEYIIDLINQSFNSNHEIIKNIYFENYKSSVTNLFYDNKLKIMSSYEGFDYHIALDEIFKKIKNNFIQHQISNKTFYFPASRTGFVLAFDEIVSGVFGQFGGKPTTTKMTEPMIDFISNFSKIKSGNFFDEEDERDINTDNSIQKLFEFIEKRIIKGKIIEETTAQNYTQFYLETSNKEKLNLHLSSSATVELLPLIIFLKHFSSIEDRLLVIEEPEAHLHPKAQIEMARLLVMLSNAGAKVLLTTHSDYILNEISNCIKLSNASTEKKKKYLERYELDESTVISSNDVSAYLFKDIEGEKVEVDALIIDEYGIANDNFDDILDELLERTDEINEMVL